MLFVYLGASRVPPSLCKPASLSTSLFPCQQYSINVPESEEKVEEPPGFFKRLWRWMHSNDDHLEVGGWVVRYVSSDDGWWVVRRVSGDRGLGIITTRTWCGLIM